MSTISFEHVIELLSENRQYNELVSMLWLEKSAMINSINYMTEVEFDPSRYDPDYLIKNMQSNTATQLLSYAYSNDFECANYIFLKVFLLVCFCKIFKFYIKDPIEVNADKNPCSNLFYGGVTIKNINIDNVECKRVQITWIGNIAQLNSTAVELLSNPKLRVDIDNSGVYTVKLSEFTKEWFVTHCK